MGVAVSSWRLARSVAQAGQLGVVSGTAVDVVVAHRLQDGDEGGHVRRALAHFPVPRMAEQVLGRYYRPAGRGAGEPYAPVPKPSRRPGARAVELAVVAAFAEVWLAREGHDGAVGINFLEKIQMATPGAAYGALLAGVEYVLMGAGIPSEIPALLDALARHEPARLTLHVEGATTAYEVGLDPEALTGGGLPELRRPRFLAVVSADVLAARLAREEVTRPDGFVVEGPSAGGHNAPPRARGSLTDDGQSLFGPRDVADLARVARVGLPFWLAGGCGTAEALAAARAAGAAGVQVGSLFALCTESGLEAGLRRAALDRLADGRLEVRTDPLASPTGFPFKVATLPGTLSDPALAARRVRLCDGGYLRTPVEHAPGRVGYRCPAEPVDTYVRKGGHAQDALGRVCLCNALMSSVGLGQVRPTGYHEPPLVTLGSDLDGPARMVRTHPDGWSAADAVEFLLAAPARA
jgi:NAD(P)H-dependent flavin oxidoreductase YrpB (nitropropane dioxygenase family)